MRSMRRWKRFLDMVMASCTLALIPAREERCSNAILMGRSSIRCWSPSAPNVVSLPYEIAALLNFENSVLPSNCERAVYPPYSESVSPRSNPSLKLSSSLLRYPRALRIAPLCSLRIVSPRRRPGGRLSGEAAGESSPSESSPSSSESSSFFFFFLDFFLDFFSSTSFFFFSPPFFFFFLSRSSLGTPSGRSGDVAGRSLNLSEPSTSSSSSSFSSSSSSLSSSSSSSSSSSFSSSSTSVSGSRSVASSPLGTSSSGSDISPLSSLPDPDSASLSSSLSARASALRSAARCLAYSRWSPFFTCSKCRSSELDMLSSLLSLSLSDIYCIHGKPDTARRDARLGPDDERRRLRWAGSVTARLEAGSRRPGNVRD
mmetsp:Transcript_12461/g.53425  ORF Transcript_12461/g.53425 Transcript_12461/m.53425 type:complete len:372 (+) Transcript_12461:440-1555(+)